MNVSVHEFKQNLAKMLAAAEQGEKVIITRYGRPFVEVGPVGRTGGFDFSAEDPDRAEFGLDGPPVPVLDDLDDPAWSRAVLGIENEEQDKGL